MKTKIKIKNFKVFPSEGVSIDILPITLLTGCNNSGKTSVVQSLGMLNGYLYDLDKISTENQSKYELRNLIVDFTKRKFSQLGNYGKILNKMAKDNKISFEVTYYSRFISDYLKIEYVFAAKERDVLKNAVLFSYSIKDMDDTILFSSHNKGYTMHLSGLVDAFIRYSFVEDVVKRNANLELFDKKERSELEKLEIEFCAEHGKNVWDDAKISYSLFHQPFEKYDVHYFDLIKRAYLKKSFFYFDVLDDICKTESSDIFGCLFSYFDNSNTIPPHVNVVLKLIDNDYRKSGCKDFSDYYRIRESDFLNTDNSRYNDMSPELFHPSNLNIKKGIPQAPYEIKGYKNKNANVEASSKVFGTEKISFPVLYSVIELVNNEYCKHKNNKVFLKSADFEKPLCSFADWCTHMFNEAIVGVLQKHLDICETIIPNNKKSYPLANEDTFTEILKQYFQVQGESLLCNGAVDFVNNWIRNFELGDRFEVNVDENSLAATIKLYESKNDNDGMLLSYKGLGVFQLFVLLARVAIGIYNYPGEFPNRKDIDQEYDLLTATRRNYTIVLSEPEAHLHPKKQALLADMFFDAYNRFGIHFIIETHSEYLIRRYQYLIANKDIKKDIISVVYIDNPDSEKRAGSPQVRNIKIHENGRLSDRFGTGFYDVSDNLSMDILKLNYNVTI